MTEARSDVLVVGGGVFGLWCARACLEAGLSVTLAEAGAIGAGASATPVGALAPHDPVGWSHLKAMQLAGLRTLPGEVARLEAETGRETGYRPSGRLALLRSEAARARVPERAAAATAAWAGAGALRLVEPGAPELDGVAPEAAPFGAALDTLSAQIDPPLYLAALAASLDGRARLLLGWRCLRLEPGGAAFDRGRIFAERVVLANGWQALALAGLASPRAGVKGQAALLAPALAPGRALVTAPGLYVVAHRRGVAVGATSEPDWTDPAPDAALDDVVAAARATLPALAGAKVRARWAGIRPRPPGRGPLVGALPDAPKILLATGGFKIGLALAHSVGQAVAAEIVGRPAPALPSETRPGAQLTKGLLPRSTGS